MTLSLIQGLENLLKRCDMGKCSECENFELFTFPNNTEQTGRCTFRMYSNGQRITHGFHTCGHFNNGWGNNDNKNIL